MKAFAKKIQTTHIYDDLGRHVAVTVLGLLNSVAIAKKTTDKDGYEAVVYALNDEKAKVKKPQAGQYKGIKAKKVEEERVEDSTGVELKEIKIEDFAEGDIIKIVSSSKGKGFAGTIKRHGFHTGPKTHGSHNYRQPGSIGVTDPSRVLLGKKMPGRLGGDRTTLQKVKIIRVENDLNRIWVKGSVAGPTKSTMVITK